MSFLDRLFGTASLGSSESDTRQKEFAGRLHQKIRKLLPKYDHKEQLKLACLAGLFARIAYADMDISDIEQQKISAILREWSDLEETEVQAVSKLACQEIVDLCGLENTRYCGPLAELMTTGQRMSVLTALFAVAAADGSVEHLESEEIRNVAKGLLLEHKHYISARATVLDKLKLLKK